MNNRWRASHDDDDRSKAISRRIPQRTVEDVVASVLILDSLPRPPKALVGSIVARCGLRTLERVGQVDHSDIEEGGRYRDEVSHVDPMAKHK